MFFVLSKLLDFLISPLFVVLVLLVIGIFGPFKVRRSVLLSALVILYIVSNAFLVSLISRAWEVADTLNSGKTYEAGIVPTGFMTYNTETREAQFSNSADRLTESLKLYRDGRIKKILISGGTGSLTVDFREALAARDFLVDFCHIPADDVIIDTLSRNTHENAVESLKLMQKHNLRSAVLITDAIHMRRAWACYRKAGLVIDTYSTDRSFWGTWDTAFLPDSEAPGTFRYIIHELIGYIIYSLKGYI